MISGRRLSARNHQIRLKAAINDASPARDWRTSAVVADREVDLSRY
jgi:hypothetical protein